MRGYNGFSYADISAELAITKPSIHYHFPSKAELAEALIARYRQRFAAARQEVDDAAAGARERLAGYARLYAEVFTDGGRMCLCGVFAADAASLPPGVRRATAAFFDDQRAGWPRRSPRPASRRAGTRRGGGVPGGPGGCAAARPGQHARAGARLPVPAPGTVLCQA